MSITPKPNKDESFEEYCHRISQQREELNYSWQDIADSANEHYKLNLSKDAYRKRESRYREHSANILDLEKYKLADQKAQLKALERRVAREETIKEIARDYALAIETLYKLPEYKPHYCCIKPEKEGILLISDWHYGVEENSSFNVYNPDICRERVALLRDQVLEIIEKEGLTRVNILNLGDMICGIIHLKLRLKTRIDVLTQILEVSELIAQFIYEIASRVEAVDYYSTADNHSRIDPNVKDSLELESLYRITDWFLKWRFKGFKNITFHDNFYGDDILTFECLNHKIAAVHGHKDKPEKIIDNLTLFTKNHYDMICSAHFHHFSCDEKNETVLVSNSSLMGTDDFARTLRLNSKPSQIMIISSRENVCECIYKILLE